MDKNAPVSFNAYLKSYIKKVLYTLKHPWMLLPTVVIMGVWILLGFLKSHLGESPLLSFFNFLTFAQGGLFGGVVGAIGGIIGKILIAALLNALIMPLFIRGKKPASKFKEGFQNFGKSFSFDSLKALSAFFLGMGVALLLYSFFNITQRWQEGLVGIVGAVLLIQGMGRKGGLMFSLTYSIVSALLKNKIPSQMNIYRFLSGMTIGFIVGTGMNVCGLKWAVLISLCLLGLGIFFAIFGSRRKSAMATACICAFLLLPAFAQDAVKQATGQLGGVAGQLDQAIAEGRKAIEDLDKLQQPVNTDDVDMDMVADYNDRITEAENRNDLEEARRLQEERDQYIKEALGIESDDEASIDGEEDQEDSVWDDMEESLTQGWAGEDSYVDSENAAMALEAAGGVAAMGAAGAAGAGGSGAPGPQGPLEPQDPQESQEPEPVDWEEEKKEEEEPEEEDNEMEGGNDGGNDDVEQETDDYQDVEESEGFDKEEEMEEPEEEQGEEDVAEEPENEEEEIEEPEEEEEEQEEDAEEEEQEEEEEPAEEESEEPGNEEGQYEVPEDVEEEEPEQPEEEPEQPAEEPSESQEETLEEEVQEEVEDYDEEAERLAREAEQAAINARYMSEFRKDADQFASRSDEERINREMEDERKRAWEAVPQEEKDRQERVKETAEKHGIDTVDSLGEARDIEDIQRDTEHIIRHEYINELHEQQVCAETERFYSERIAEAELVDNVSEGTVNVLGECTGPAGKQVKNWHALIKSTAVGYQEAKCDGRNRMVGTLGGMGEGLLTVGQNILGDDGVLPGGGFKKTLAVGTTTVFFEGTKTLVHETVRGTDLNEAVEKAQTSMVKKTGEVAITSVMGTVFDKVPGIAKNKFGASDSTAKMWENIGKGNNALIGETYSRGHDLMTVGSGDNEKNISQMLTEDFNNWKNSQVEKLF